MSTKDTQWPLWEVFVQLEEGAPHEHAGSVHAPDSELALQNARDVYTRRGTNKNIWVVPADSITSTTTGEKECFFDPSNDKIRHVS